MAAARAEQQRKDTDAGGDKGEGKADGSEPACRVGTDADSNPESSGSLAGMLVTASAKGKFKDVVLDEAKMSGSGRKVRYGKGMRAAKGGGKGDGGSGWFRTGLPCRDRC